MIAGKEYVGASCLNFYSDRKSEHYSKKKALKKHYSKQQQAGYQLLTGEAGN